MKSILSMFQTADGKLHVRTFLLVCCIFVCTGLCNGMIDSLNKHFQNSFEVSKATSAFVQFSWYLAYFLLALPSGWYARRFGYRAGIVTGLALVVLGSLIVYPAAIWNTFAAFLAGIRCVDLLEAAEYGLQLIGGYAAALIDDR